MEPIAIVGVSFKMPQEAVDEEAFWNVLTGRKNLMTEWPRSRTDVDSFCENGSKRPNTLHSRGAHFTKADPGAFDAFFFSVSEREALAMDPQQRWALEATYHALENAGIGLDAIRGSNTGVFASSFADDYTRILAKDPDTAPRHTGIGTAFSIQANRVSWFFNLRGPSMHIDTACSGGLVALDMACQSIQSGDSEAAIVIGSSLLLSPEGTTLLSNMNFLSPDSRCYSFDSRGNGFARGEGIIVLVIKPLKTAIMDGDTIRAVIRATASNQDGRTPGLTQPSCEAQESLIRRTYAKAGLGFSSTRFVEAHGTGTVIGDPIEMKAIGRVFRSSCSAADPLFVGSVKANIGHLEAASGLAGIVKAILMLEKGTIPPNALFEKLHPDIDAEFLHIQVPTKNIPWPNSGLRRISVNSFGFGGTNSHVILDDALHYLQSCDLRGHHCTTGMSAQQCGRAISARPSLAADPDASDNHKSRPALRPKLLVWSAADAAATQRMTEAYQLYCQQHMVNNDDKLSQLAYTLAVRRTILPWRMYSVMAAPMHAERLVNGDAEAKQVLHTLSKSAEPVRASTGNSSLVFVFTGQGAQYAGMGMELQQYRVFANSLCESDKILAKLGCKWSIFDVMNDPEKMHCPEYSQPLCTILQVAMVELFRTFGMTPVAVAGHSSGEIAAAFTIGALTHESACKVAYYRGQVAERCRKISETGTGAMLSVNLTEEEAIAYLADPKIAPDSIAVACVNSHTNLTLSGSSRSIDIVKTKLDKLGIFAHKVNTGLAYHTLAMANVAAEYLHLMGTLDMNSRAGHPISMISTVTGQPVTKKVLALPKYWVNNLVSQVKFLDAISHFGHSVSSSLLSEAGKITDLVEIGPHGALRRPIKDTIPSVRYHSALDRAKSPMHTVLELLGTLFCHGHDVSVLVGNDQDLSDLPTLVDCPPYPFDHSRQYWTESRLSRDYRLRAQTLGFVLGRRAHDWNPLQPRWRNWFCEETMPWLAGHVVNERVIFPGAGILTMVLEAAKDPAISKGRLVSGIHLTDVDFISPITVGKDFHNSTEVVTELRPIQNTFEKDSRRFEVRIFSYTNENCTLSFRTELELQFEESSSQHIAWSNERYHEKTRIRKLAILAARACRSKIDQRAFYSFCDKHGLRFGAPFQLLHGIFWNGNDTSTALINVASASQLDYDTDAGPVHPTVLDAALQLLIVQASKGATRSRSTLVPKGISSVWIACKPWHRSASPLSVVSVMSELDGPISGISGTVHVVDGEGQPVCSIENLSMAGVSHSTPMDNERDAGSGTLLHNIVWKPRLSSLDATGLQRICSANSRACNKIAQNAFYRKLELAMRASARKALRELQADDLDKAPGYMVKYVAALQRQFGIETPEGEEQLSDSAIESLFQECETERPPWRMFPAVGRSLPSIIRGETNVLELLFGSKAAEEFYAHSFGSLADDPRLRTFLDLATHETPGLNILEVGAGTGSMTRSILAALSAFEQETGQTRFSNYSYTDISPSFFEESRAKFQEFSDRMSFKTLDLEVDPLQQDFREASYDMIIAGSVLHATTNLSATLEKCNKLLKAGGHLVFLEITTLDSACANIGFGAFEGWWLGSEEWRRYSPLATKSQWDELLRHSGFSGVDLTIGDTHSDGEHLISIMISRKLAKLPNEHTASVTNGISNGISNDISNGISNGINNGINNGISSGIGNRDPWADVELTFLVDPNSRFQTSLADEVGECSSKYRKVTLDAKAGASQVLVCLLEVDCARLAELEAPDFDALREHLLAAQCIVWVTIGSLEDPKLALATGFFRALRNELDHMHLVTLSIASCTPGTEAGLISRTLGTCLQNISLPSDVELLVIDGVVHIGRLAEEKTLDAKRAARTKPRLASSPWERGPRLAAEFSTPGMLDSLRFVEVDESDLGPYEVEIKAAVWPISFRDIFIALGRLGKEELGFECAGTVTRTGASCAGDFVPGDRVLMVVPGSMRSHPRAHVDAVFKLPENVPYFDAVAGMNPGMTAWYALTHVARLQPGEKVLIHAAAGSTGQMAVKIAQRLGAEVFVTVGSEDKRQFVMRSTGLNIPESHVFYSRNTSFAAGIKRVTHGYGVDVVLNSLSGDGLRASWQCMAPYGRFVDIGKADIKANSSLPMAGFAQNVSFASVDLHHIVLTNSALTRELVEKSLELALDQGVGVPDPLHEFPVSELEGAFRLMQSGKHIGRILVTINPDDIVQKHLVTRTEWRFDARASYLIAGGLGGLGRAIVRWMCDRGAKNFILPSRSGASSRVAQDLLDTLQSEGVNVMAPHCDIASEPGFKMMLKDCSQMPPIRGCINLAMVLQDSMFENMSHAQWSESIRTKVDGSWNLHQFLPQLDFFILMSSLAGVYGSPAQSNYAAGNTFQDALAHMRASKGGFGTSISLDLGWMQDAGYAYEKFDEQQTRLIARHFVPIKTQDLLAVLEHFCDPSLPPPGPEHSQLLIGAKTPTHFAKRGEVTVPMFKRPLFSPFDVIRPNAEKANGRVNGFGPDAEEAAAQAFQKATTPKERASAVVEALRAKVSKALGVAVEDIDSSKGLTDYGVDSLMAVELRNWIWWRFHTKIAVFEIMNAAMDINGVGQIVAGKAE